MTQIHLIIARDVEKNINVYRPPCDVRYAEGNVLEHIGPLPALPLQELLSEEDVLPVFGIDLEWLKAKMVEMMGIDFEEMEKRYVGILVVLADVHHWATLVLAWGERYEAQQREIYEQLMEDFSSYKRNLNGLPENC